MPSVLTRSCRGDVLVRGITHWKGARATLLPRQWSGQLGQKKEGDPNDSCRPFPTSSTRLSASRYGPLDRVTKVGRPSSPRSDRWVSLRFSPVGPFLSLCSACPNALLVQPGRPQLSFSADFPFLTLSERADHGSRYPSTGLRPSCPRRFPLLRASCSLQLDRRHKQLTLLSY